MTIARVSEVSASSTLGFHDATIAALARAAETLNNVTGAWVQDQWVTVMNRTISEYRVRMRVTFLVDE
jgi:hypothetical protein